MTRTSLVRSRLFIAFALVLSPSTWAQSGHAAPASDGEDDHHVHDLNGVRVTSNPLHLRAESLAQPVELLHGEALDKRKAATLGDTLSALPGVQTSSFGAGVGRPVIRGQEGPRVQVLAGGMGSMDASTVSADHAIAVEPFLADQIEVLKGPATLLFGSGAIGGAVNVVDGRLAETLPERPLSGRVEVRGNTGNDERTGMFRLDGVNGNWVIHIDGVARDTGDYKIPGQALLAHDEHDAHDDHDEQSHSGRVSNSAVKTRAGALGATWLGEQGYFGIAASTFRTRYGIPEGAHVHAQDDHGHDHDHDDDHAHDEESPVTVDLVQNRIDLKAGLYNPVSWLKSAELRMTHSDYEHVELEGSQVGTRFNNRGDELRLQLVQQDWRDWHGVVGVQATRSDFSAQGAEAFVPSTLTESLGLFVLQHREFGPLKLELGGRYDHVDVSPSTQQQRSFGAWSLSAASIWKFNETLDLRAGIDRSERAPTNEELFASGLHVATRTMEIGDANLDTEKALRSELGLHWHSDKLEAKFALYQTRFSDFLYLADTGLEAEGLPVRLWTQADARFHGAEAEATWHLNDGPSGFWDLRFFGDIVRAELSGRGTRTAHFDVPHGDHAHHEEAEIALSGGLPRIAPARLGTELSWSREGWRASLGAVHYTAQDRVAPNEAASPGYTLIDAHLAYRWELPASQWEVFLDGSNLGNRDARAHTSLLRDFAPLPGRSLAFGIRAYF